MNSSGSPSLTVASEDEAKVIAVEAASVVEDMLMDSLRVRG